ncbi:flagellin [Saccharococcus sp. Marseille-Q5394]|uniref:flagellin n=1 Tax=Saccharococcus sp. Marseille-Q5394 TaxID=2972778 RepID=UPI0039674E3E
MWSSNLLKICGQIFDWITFLAKRSKLGIMQNRQEHTINNIGSSSEKLTAEEPLWLMSSCFISSDRQGVRLVTVDAAA